MADRGRAGAWSGWTTATTMRIAQLRAARRRARCALANGDVLRAFSVGGPGTADAAPEQARAHRGRGGDARANTCCRRPARSPTRCRAAGGLTPSGLPLRHRVHAARACARRSSSNYDRALRDLETDLAHAERHAAHEHTPRRRPTRDASPAQATNRWSSNCAQLKPTGRSGAATAARQPPNCPTWRWRTATGSSSRRARRPIGVFGSVFNAGSYLYGDEPQGGRLPAPGRRAEAGRRPRQRLRRSAPTAASSAACRSRAGSTRGNALESASVRARRHDLRARGDGQDDLDPEREGLDAVALPVRHRPGGYQERGQLNGTTLA
ncbi:MAG: hypothetical protein MZW92_58825 [Comamonadaceae bacterium]|nr:hypothetical protein [Comamonadaceae bacterium]